MMAKPDPKATSLKPSTGRTSTSAGGALPTVPVAQKLASRAGRPPRLLPPRGGGLHRRTDHDLSASSRIMGFCRSAAAAGRGGRLRQSHESRCRARRRRAAPLHGFENANRCLERVAERAGRRGLSAPHEGRGGAEALQTTCPHAGCMVDYRPDSAVFKCPCHNSAFQLDGSIIEPSPAPRPMDSLRCEVRTRAGTKEVWVEFENFYTGIGEKIAKT